MAESADSGMFTIHHISDKHASLLTFALNTFTAGDDVDRISFAGKMYVPYVLRYVEQLAMTMTHA